MKLPRYAGKKARIEIIPMIDTMFFLLVFFMIATLTMTMQRGIGVNLPHAATAKEELREVITLTLTKEGRIFIDKQEVASMEEVSLRLDRERTRVSEVSVVINADKAVEHGRVVEVLDRARQNGITRIAIAIRPKGES